MGPAQPYGLHQNEYLTSLAWVLRQMGQTEEAETCYRDAVEVCRNIWGAGDTRYHEALEALTDFLTQQGHFGEVEKLYRDAIDLYRDRLGTDHARYHEALERLASFLKDQGRMEEALPLLAERAQLLYKPQDQSYDKPPYDLVDLAMQYLVLEKWKEAEPLLREADRIFEIGYSSLFVNEDPEYFKNTHNLGALLLITGRYEKAKANILYLMRALSGYKGNDSDEYAVALHNLEVLIATAYPADQGAWVYLEIIKDEDEGLGLSDDLDEDIQAKLQTASRLSEALAVLKTVDATDEPILAAARRFAKGEPPPKGVRIALQDWKVHTYKGIIPVEV